MGTLSQSRLRNGHDPNTHQSMQNSWQTRKHDPISDLTVNQNSKQVPNCNNICIELCSIQKDDDPHSVFFRQRRAINFKTTKATKCLSVVGLSSLLLWTKPQQEALLFTYISLWRIGYWRLENLIAHRSAFHRRSTPTSGLRRHNLIDKEEITARSAARISQSESG
jgi:hypothetical protein